MRIRYGYGRNSVVGRCQATVRGIVVASKGNAHSSVDYRRNQGTVGRRVTVNKFASELKLL